MLEKPLTFVGRIIADFTHEINNHLALIKESAGLIGDICRGKKSVDKKEMPYIIESLDAIESQIQKSITFISYFNRFAHRMDSLRSSFDLKSAIEELFELLRRYSARKKVSLKYNISSDVSTIEGSPFLVEFAIFSVIDSFLKKSKTETSITLDAKRTANFIEIKISYEGDFSEVSVQEQSQSEVEQLLSLVNASIMIKDKTAEIKIPA